MNIGSAWKKTSRDGEDFISCVIQVPFLGEMSFAIFKAKEKRSQYSPDYVISWSYPRKEKEGNASKPKAQSSGVADPWSDDNPPPPTGEHDF